ncbi:MAG: DUF58 domain-containing protein [Actinomycetota bacterium]
MPSARGWIVADAGLSLLVLGRAFGTPPLGQTGFALIVLVVLAVIVVRMRRHDLDVTRRITPERATAGQVVHVTLGFANRGRGAAPMVLLQDRLPAALPGSARFALPGLEPGGSREASYTIRPPRRGRYEIGPTEMIFADPFGLARTRGEIAGTADLLVHPRIESLALPRDLGRQRSLGTSDLRHPTGATGDDFYALREYVEGDDLRKIHWPSTAKRGRYMIRQDETSWHTRATVLLDDRKAAYAGANGPASFERAVEAAASLVALYDRSGYTYRLAGAHAAGLGSGRGRAHFTACLDLLATVGWQPPTGTGRMADPLLVRLAEIEARGKVEGTLVVASGGVTPDVAVAMAGLHRVFRQIILISFPPLDPAGASRPGGRDDHRWHEVARLLVRSGARPVVLSPGESLQDGWRSLSRARGQGGDAWARRHELV